MICARVNGRKRVGEVSVMESENEVLAKGVLDRLD